jgi:hypothetical protein
MTERALNSESPEKSELEMQDINLDLRISSCAKDLETSEYFTADIFIPNFEGFEYIDYDEALLRAGGFGVYQVIMFLAISIFSVYGDCIIFNFVYFTSPFKQNCKSLGEENFHECSRTEFCANRLNPGFMTQPHTEDKDYIYAMTGANLDMNCWSDTSIALIA